LELGDIQLDAERVVRPKPLEERTHLFPKLDEVPTIAHRNGDAESWLSAGPAERLGRVDIAAFHVNEISQGNELAAPRQGDRCLAELGYGFEIPRRLERHPLEVCGHRSPRSHDVLRRENRAELCRGQAVFCQPPVRILEKDPLLLGPVDLDLRRVGQEEEFVADLLGDFPKLSVGEAGTCDRNQDPVDVSVLVVHERADAALGEVGLHRLDLAADVVPNGLEVEILLPELDEDERDPRPGLARHLLELGNLPNRGLDSVRDESLDPIRACAGKIRRDQGDPDQEAGIFIARQAHIGL
jgi:hypothetical protein